MLMCCDVDLLGVKFHPTLRTRDDFTSGVRGALESTWCRESLYGLNASLIAFPVSSQDLPTFSVRFGIVNARNPAKPRIALDIPNVVTGNVNGNPRLPCGHYSIEHFDEGASRCISVLECLVHLIDLNSDILREIPASEPGVTDKMLVARNALWIPKSSRHFVEKSVTLTNFFGGRFQIANKEDWIF